MLKALEAQGLVRRTQSASDRRSVELRLTEAGEARAARMQAMVARHEVASAAGLTERERGQLKRLLRKMTGAAPRPRPSAPSDRADASA